MRAIFILAFGLTLSGTALAQNNNLAKTGSGNPSGTLEALQAEIKKMVDSRPGKVTKGMVGLTGVFAALSAASDALNFRIRADGSIVSGGSSSTNIGATVGTTTTSSSTSTN